MEKSQNEKVRENDEQKLKNGGKESQQLLKQQSSATATTSPSSTAAILSPPSATSPPAHEFSFTVSVQSSAPITANLQDNNKSKSSPPSFAIDLTPADDIFFHGHLLPLHLLSHLPVSPRSSTNSMDNLTLPNRGVSNDQKPIRESKSFSHSNRRDDLHHPQISHNKDESFDNSKTKPRIKSKSFSLFGLPKWRKGCEEMAKVDRDQNQRHKRKLSLDLSHILKRYMRMVRPFLSFRGRRDNSMRIQRNAYSFSGNLGLRNGSNYKQELKGRREFSAPASMRTSPTNSGLLVPPGTFPSNTSDSTMEELQAAIQAAIAHCKNSIAVDQDKIKCQE